MDMFSLAQKRISLRYPCPGGREISIFVFSPSYLLLFYFKLIVIIARRPLKLAILNALLFLQSITCFIPI